MSANPVLTDRQLEESDRVSVAPSDFIGFLQMVRFGREVAWRLAGALTLIVTAVGTVMVAARILGRLVEALVAGEGGVALWGKAALFLSLEFSAVFCQYFGRLQLARVTVEVALAVRRELFTKMQRLPMTYYDQQPLGRTLTRLTADVESMEGFFSGTLAKVIIAMIQIVAVLLAMLWTDPGFGIVITAASVPALLFTVALRGPVRYWLRAYKRRSAMVNARLAEFLNGMPVIRSFGLEAWTTAEFDGAVGSQLAAGLGAMNWNSFIRPVALLLCGVPTLLILWLGGTRVLAGAMELGALVAFVRYSERFTSPIRTVSQEIQRIQESLVASERVRRMLAEDEENDVLGPDGKDTPPLVGRIEYRDVCMRYGTGQPVLRNINFSVAPGMKVALVGATGSGKTSTVNLLPRLYPFQSGDILIDGWPIASLSRSHLRHAIGYVGQDVVVFAGTMRDNLLMAAQRPLNDLDLARTARITGLDRVLAGLSAGLDHRLVDGGENLSMGERQLIAFTRILLRDPRVLILDEATANIDESLERLLQRAVTETMSGRTCFVIAHRLSTIVQCDLILVFRDGTIVEQGTHQGLLAQGGEYAGLVARQMASPVGEKGVTGVRMQPSGRD